MIENSINEKNNQHLTSKQSATSKQLNTSNDIFFMIFNQNDVFYFFCFIDNDRIFRFAFDLDKNSNAVNNQNVAQRKKQIKFKTASKNVTFEELSKIDQIFLKMTDFKSKKSNFLQM